METDGTEIFYSLLKIIRLNAERYLKFLLGTRSKSMFDAKSTKSEKKMILSCFHMSLERSKYFIFKGSHITRTIVRFFNVHNTI